MVAVVNILKRMTLAYDCKGKDYEELIKIGDKAMGMQPPILSSNINYLKEQLRQYDIRDFDVARMRAYEYAREAVYELEKKVID